jgi:hypothetical protein
VNAADAGAAEFISAGGGAWNPHPAPVFFYGSPPSSCPLPSTTCSTTKIGAV